MKRNLLLAAFVAVGLPLLAEDGLRVTPHDGESVIYLFSQEPEISFLSDKLSIGSKDASSPFVMDLDNVAAITFEKNLSAVELDEADAMYFFADAAGLHFRNVEAGVPVVVTDLSGKVLLNSRSGDSGEVDIDRSDFAKATLVVKVGKMALKVAM